MSLFFVGGMLTERVPCPGPDEVNGSIVCLLRVLLHAGVLD